MNQRAQTGPAVAVVIVNYRIAALTLDALRSVLAEDHAPLRVHVWLVDNASGDDSVRTLRCAIADEGWGDCATLLEATANEGFAAGNNLAFEAALRDDESNPLGRVDFVHMLNPDTIARPGAITELVAQMEATPAAGVVGSRLEDLDGTQQISAFRYPTWQSELESALQLGVASKLLNRWLVSPGKRTDAHQIDWVSGASLMIRRDVLDQVGLFDPDYFMYYEETDFCRRAKRRGWEVWYAPESRVVHLIGQSSGMTAIHAGAPRRKRQPTYWFASRNRYYVKHHGRFYLAWVHIVSIPGFALWRVRRWLQRKPDLDPPHFLGDLVRNSCRLTFRPRH